jgi:tRNA modification GTPase
LGAVEVSLKTGEGMEALRRAMREALGMAGSSEPRRDAPAVSNLRHVGLLEGARASLDRAIVNLRESGELASEELVIADLADARRAFEDVTGRRTSEDVLRHIFATFCIGK